MASKKSVPHFATQSRTVLSGSEKAPLAEAGGEKPAPLAARITVSVIVRRKTPLKAAHITGEQRLTRAQFNDSHAADPAAVKLVQRFAKEFGLTVQPGTPAPGRRTVKLTGTVANMQRAFGVSLAHKTMEGVTYRVREGSINLPAELQGYVVAVLGLDNRPQAEPHFASLANRVQPLLKPLKAKVSPVPTPEAVSPIRRSRSANSTNFRMALQHPIKQSASSNLAAAFARQTLRPTSKPSVRSHQP